MPGARSVAAAIGKVDFLALSTPILAYAGMSLRAQEVAVFKKTGIRLLVVALLVFFGTFLASALISQVALDATLGPMGRIHP